MTRVPLTIADERAMCEKHEPLTKAERNHIIAEMDRWGDLWLIQRYEETVLALESALLAARREVEEATQLLGSIRKHCRVVYYYPRPSSNYPIEHAPHARKDCWDMIVAALAATPEEK